MILPPTTTVNHVLTDVDALVYTSPGDEGTLQMPLDSRSIGIWVSVYGLGGDLRYPLLIPLAQSFTFCELIWKRRRWS